MKKSIYILLAIFLSACMPAGVRVPQSPLLSVLERKVGLIAYIGIDGNIYATNQGASNTTQLTEDASSSDEASNSLVAYQAPTWSLDGNQLAFIRLERSASKLSSELFVANMDADTVKRVYSSESERPFYLYWSPDDKNLSFLSSTAMGQTMLLQSVAAAGGEQRRVLDTGSPFYWSWAPDGKTMIVHRGMGDPAVPNRLSFLKMDTNVNEYAMEEIPATFQAPAWSPNGEYILLTGLTDNTQEIVLADATGTPIKTIDTFDVNAALAWSFDSERFAYISGTQLMSTGTIGNLHVWNITPSEEIVIEENIIGFFWSPNGKKLAYLIPFVAGPEAEGSESDSTMLYFQLKVLDIATGESKELFAFRPTESFVSIIPYFDQYHQSTTIWSPDSNNLVISFINPDGNPGIATVAASGQLEPRFIADGLFAVWSWK